MDDFIGTATLVVAVVTVAVTAAGALFVLPAFLETRRRDGQDRFVAERAFLKGHRATLAQSAAALYPTLEQLPDVPLLFPPGWLPAAPLPLDAVAIRLRPDAPASPPVRPGRLLPERRAGGRYERYSDATRDLDKPALFRNGPSYRLVAVEPDERSFHLEVTHGRYFDMLDTCEILGLELAHVVATLRSGDRPSMSKTPLRQAAGGPADLQRRCVIPGINTLTIRVDGSRAGFFMHRRDSSKVASAMGMYHVAPAGEFQPGGIDPTTFADDADLWRNIVREYAEEFLGEPDAAGMEGRSIDWARDRPYSTISSAGKRGDIRRYFLGVGVDPLTMKAEILTACVIKAATFDRIFAGRMSGENEEGKLVVGHGNVGVPFTEDRVRQFIAGDDVETLPAGAACLALAWRWRSHLLPQASAA